MPPVAGALGTIGTVATGVGALGSLFGGGKGPATEAQTTLDPFTIRQRGFVGGLSREAADAARGFQAQGLTGNQQSALGGFGGLNEQLAQILGQGTPGLGFQSQAFDPSQAQSFLNPFATNAINLAANERRGQDTLRARQLAEASGAFGGSRSAIFEAEAARGAEIDRAQQLMQAQDLAQRTALAAHEGNQNRSLQAALGNQGAQIAGRGQSLQGLGIGSSLLGQQFGLGEIERQILERQQNQGITGLGQALQFAGQGFGPVGQTTSTAQGAPGFFQSLGGIGLALQGLGGGGGSGNVVPAPPMLTELRNLNPFAP